MTKIFKNFSQQEFPDPEDEVSLYDDRSEISQPNVGLDLSMFTEDSKESIKYDETTLEGIKIEISDRNKILRK